MCVCVCVCVMCIPFVVYFGSIKKSSMGLLILRCFQFSFQRWLEITSKKSRKPPKCEICHYQYHRHKKFKVD